MWLEGRTGIATAMASALLWVSAQASAAELAGVAKIVRGDVRLERAGAASPLRVGDHLEAQDRVVVPADGSVGITLKDETLISLGPNSTVVLDRFAFDAKTWEGRVETSLLRGTLRFVTGLIGRLNPRAVSVTTPHATIGIRGTDFIVEVQDAN